MMIDTYNSIVELQPYSTIRTPSATTSLGSPTTVFSSCKKSKVITRFSVEADFARTLPASYWMDKYVRIKNIETGINYNEATISSISKNATDLINNLDIFTALSYTNSKFDNVAHFEGSLFYDVTKLEMREDPNATASSLKERVQQSVQASNFVQH